MPVRIYAHLTWTTFGRLPLIDSGVVAFLEKFLPTECARHGVRLIALGVMRDHVHLLLELPASFSVPRLVQGLKGASARIANRDGIARHESLRWAQGYDLRSVGPRQLGVVEAYVRNQTTRHPEKAVVAREIRAQGPNGQATVDPVR
ncbi:MAG TPA: IS200/IS605 family transposase [Gemmatimonadales bacterium]